MSRKKILIAVVIPGLFLPFIPASVYIVFLLIFPLVILFIASVVYLMICFFSKNLNTGKALFLVSLIPAFMLVQCLSVFTVSKIQRFRSKIVIEEVEAYKAKTGEFPATIQMPFGIDYNRMDDQKSFVVAYSSGFMGRDEYQSESNQWSSYGLDH